MLGRVRKHGFSLLEVIALVAITAIMAAVVIPVISSGTDSRGVPATKVVLDSLSAGINAYRTKITAHPSYLSNMSDSIPIAPFNVNSCEAALGGNAAKYQSQIGAPFYDRQISNLGGLPVPIGIIDNDIPTRLTGGDLIIRIRGVRVADGQALNTLVDGAADADAANGSNTTLKVRYPAPSADGTYANVDYIVTRTNNGC